MSDLSNFRVEREARNRAGAPRRTAPYSEAVNRYLGFPSYVDPYAPISAPAVAAGEAAGAGPVVVGVDDHPSGHVAVDLAAIEAGVRGAGLLILHAGPLARDAGVLDRLTERVHGFLPRVAVTTRLSGGTGAAEALLSEAGRADLIVVGHRHGAAWGLLGLSVADRVAARHPGPVLVVRVPGWPPGPELATPPLVVGVDGSAAASRAADFAVAEARIRGCDVTLVHVTRQPSERPNWTDRCGGVAVHNRTVAGDPASELVAASAHATAIVLGRDRRHTRLGPVSRAVLHHACCPVFFTG